MDLLMGLIDGIYYYSEKVHTLPLCIFVTFSQCVSGSHAENQGNM